MKKWPLLAMLLVLLVWGCAEPPVNREPPPPEEPEPVHAEVDESRPNYYRDRHTHEARSDKFMIAAEGEKTALAAKKMFELGGNAIDAAAAASFAIGVEQPESTGIGGGGFMLVFSPRTKQVTAVDFREKAPRKATEKMFLDAKDNVVPDLSTAGVLSAGVPGMVKGVLEIQEHYGKLTRQQVMQPAIDLAEGGVKVRHHLAVALEARKNVLAKYEASAAIFLKPDGLPLQEGDLLVQKDLARTLREISAQGAKVFYSGVIAAAIIQEERRLKGLMTWDDLGRYRLNYRRPVRGKWHGYWIYSMPPPSSGGVHILEILNILENDKLAELGRGSPEAIHLTASAMQMAFADRARFLGDPDFVKVPTTGLISKGYARTRRGEIKPDVAAHPQTLKDGNPWPHESNDTTHFSIMDSEGNAVSSTQTINNPMGSGIVIPGTGILMNNEMDDFSVKPGVANVFGLIGGKENSVQGDKRPLSSMAPTIIVKDDIPILALGSPSGPRIITCVAHTILNYLEYKMPLFESVGVLRYHHQWLPDELVVEPPSFPPAAAEALQKMGYKIVVKEVPCRVEAVAREDGRLHGVADPRADGLAVGDLP